MTRKSKAVTILIIWLVQSGTDSIIFKLFLTLHSPRHVIPNKNVDLLENPHRDGIIMFMVDVSVTPASDIFQLPNVIFISVHLYCCMYIENQVTPDTVIDTNVYSILCPSVCFPTQV